MKRQNVRKLMLLVSMLLFPVTMRFFSPMEAVEVAAKGIMAGSLVVFLTMFTLSLVFGRLWCGWLCPGGGLQEICGGVNNKRVRWKRSDTVKFVIWVPWIAVVVVLAINAGGLVRIDMLHGIPPGPFVLEGKTFVVYYILMALIEGLAVTLGRRAFCHYVCWMSPFMIIGSKIREIFGWHALRLQAESDLCSKCGLCSKYCPMGLDVQKMASTGSMHNAECILCGECVDRCARGAINFSFEPRHDAVEAGRESGKASKALPEMGRVSIGGK